MKKPRGLSLIEILIVMGIFSLTLAIVQEPLQKILTYPKNTALRRADRIEGQLTYNRLYVDLRSSVLDKVWTKTDSDGKTYLLLSFVTRFDDVNSNGRWDYILWKHEAETKVLSRQRWSLQNLAELNLPAPKQEPTGDEWDALASTPLKAVAHNVQSFLLEQPSESSVRVSFEIKNPRRNGKVDEYLLEEGS